MTTNYVHLKFTDDDVARVKLQHHGSALKAQRARFKLQALQKIDGQWRAAEDWSGESEKSYCRDKRAERIEELVLVYSNSDAGTEPFGRQMSLAEMNRALAPLGLAAAVGVRRLGVRGAGAGRIAAGGLSGARAHCRRP